MPALPANRRSLISSPAPPDRKLEFGVAVLAVEPVPVSDGLHAVSVWAMFRSWSWGASFATWMPRLCSSAWRTASSTVSRRTSRTGAAGVWARAPLPSVATSMEAMAIL